MLLSLFARAYNATDGRVGSSIAGHLWSPNRMGTHSQAAFPRIEKASVADHKEGMTFFQTKEVIIFSLFFFASLPSRCEADLSRYFWDDILPKKQTKQNSIS